MSDHAYLGFSQNDARGTQKKDQKPIKIRSFLLDDHKTMQDSRRTKLAISFGSGIKSYFFEVNRVRISCDFLGFLFCHTLGGHDDMDLGGCG